ncbi:hypothetical protein WI23_25320 [Burkholderia oklahomensis C6786]|nr:hypothetical protein WI23_25320 [Burkholderia oklahomensis C6786]KUY60831.1 hypothetical protein WI23_14175 [Burkholderia oklahomensis C6786]
MPTLFKIEAAHDECKAARPRVRLRCSGCVADEREAKAHGGAASNGRMRARRSRGEMLAPQAAMCRGRRIRS